jgi:hypothetical protein
MRGLAAGAIRDFDLCLCDTQPAAIGGAADEFVFSPRLDNLCMSYTALQGLLAAVGLEADEAVRVVALFDHEEVGSASAQGAGSPIMMCGPPIQPSWVVLSSASVQGVHPACDQRPGRGCRTYGACACPSWSHAGAS